MWFDTKKVFLTAGIGRGCQSLNAFDSALRDAKIADFNLIRVTSIVPPGVPVFHLPSEGGLIKGEGLLIPAIYESISSDELDLEIAAAVGIGMTTPETRGAGVIFGYSCRGSKQQAQDTICTMVEEGMKAKGYSQHRCEIAAVSTTVDQVWTGVLAAAVFCDAELEKLFPTLVLGQE